jgi:hypothetical protein
MGNRDDLIAKYAADIKEKCGMTPDMDLLKKVTISCGPSIYNDDASTVAGSDIEELQRIVDGFLQKKLGLPDGPELMGGIQNAIETYGRSILDERQTFGGRSASCEQGQSDARQSVQSRLSSIPMRRSTAILSRSPAAPTAESS